MKYSCSLLVVLALAGCAPSSTEVNGGGELVTLNSDLFACSYDGLFRSTNSGASWSRVDDFQKSRIFVDVVYDGTYFFATGDVDGLFRFSSRDSLVPQFFANGLPSSGEIVCVAAANSKVYCGTWGSGLFQSSDLGESWSSVPCPRLNIRSVAAKGTLICLGTDSGACYSTDNGRTWDQNNSPSWSPVVQFIGRYLYVGGSGLFRSSDNGATWKNMDVPSSVYSVTADNKYLYAGGQQLVFRSSDDGATWSPVSGLPQTTFWGLIAKGGYLFAAGSSTGIFRSSDHGDTWTESDSGIPTLNFLGLK
jgi:hypothetical protein